MLILDVTDVIGFSRYWLHMICYLKASQKHRCQFLLRKEMMLSCIENSIRTDYMFVSEYIQELHYFTSLISIYYNLTFDFKYFLSSLFLPHIELFVSRGGKHKVPGEKPPPNFNVTGNFLTCHVYVR